jgi:hypothetical protein
MKRCNDLAINIGSRSAARPSFGSRGIISSAFPTTPDYLRLPAPNFLLN